MSHSSLQILSKSLRFRGWHLAIRTFSSLHRWSMGLRSEDWLGQDLKVFLLEPLLCCLGCVFWVIVMLEYPSTTHFQCPGPWRYMALSIVYLMWCSCPVSLAEKAKHNVSTSMFDGGWWCSWGHGQHSSSKHGELIWCQRAGFWSHLTTTLCHKHPVLLWIISKLQTGLYMCFLEQGNLAGAAGFQSFMV